MEYQIFTDATADMSESMLFGLPPVQIIPMQVHIGGQEYRYGPEGNITVSEFYRLQRSGQFAMTSQASPETCFSLFESALREGKDILYLGFSSAMSGMFQVANLCAKELRAQYPERMIMCIDTLCGSVGEGMLVCEVLRKQAEGISYEDLCIWILDNRLNICHWFTVDTFEHLKHGGRVSAASAFMGTMLNIKPMLHIDGDGKLCAMEKPRGSKKAMEAQLNKMQQGWDPEISNLVVIGHADCPERALELKEQVKKQFPAADIHLADIGPIIGAHTGPGMLALIFWGNVR